MTERQYDVVEQDGWTYVRDTATGRLSGPWRYRWEAQEEADDLNIADGESQPGETNGNR